MLNEDMPGLCMHEMMLSHMYIYQDVYLLLQKRELHLYIEVILMCKIVMLEWERDAFLVNETADILFALDCICI